MSTDDGITFRYEDRPGVERSPEARRLSRDLGVDVVDGSDPTECSCAVLLKPLDSIHDLPDHVCGSIAQRSCRQWLARALGLRLDVTRGAACSGYVHVPLGDGRLAMCSGIRQSPFHYGTGFPGWPVATCVPGSPPGAPFLVLVLERWVEMEMSAGKQDCLTSTPAWKEAVHHWQEAATSHDPTVDGNDLWKASVLLAELGLPHNPGAARFLLGLEPHCMEGLLVTMFVLSTHPFDNADADLGRPDDDLVFCAAGSTQFVSQSTRRCAMREAQEVHRWWKRMSVCRMDEVDGRKVNPGRPAVCVGRYAENVQRRHQSEDEAFEDFRYGLNPREAHKLRALRRQFNRQCRKNP